MPDPDTVYPKLPERKATGRWHTGHGARVGEQVQCRHPLDGGADVNCYLAADLESRYKQRIRHGGQHGNSPGICSRHLSLKPVLPVCPRPAALSRSGLQNFRTYDLSIQFYRECKQVKLPHAIRDQLIRAASSIALNLSEGSAKPSNKERMRYYSIAFGSIREIQAIIQLEDLTQLQARADHLAASLYKLSHQ